MSVYVVPIKIGIILFPIIALLITIPYMIKQYHKFGAIPYLRTFIIYSFVLYLLIAWFMVILPLPSIESVSKMTGPWAQLVPFNGIKVILSSTNFNILNFSTYISTLKNPSVYTVLFNFLLTLPFGVYLRYYFNRKWWEVILLSFMLSLFFEVTQFSCLFGIYPRPYRLFDVDDLIVNTTGGFLGYLLTPIISKILPSRKELDEKAYSKGERVTYPRRFIATLIDFIVVCLFSLFGIFKTSLLDLPMVTLLILFYFIICTIVFNGRTLGKLIVGIKVVNYDKKRAKINQILIRYIVKYVLYFEVYHATLYLNTLDKLGAFGNIIMVVLYIMILIVYIKSFINAINKKVPQVYESLSHTMHISTIKNKKEENDELKKESKDEEIRKIQSKQN